MAEFELGQSDKSHLENSALLKVINNGIFLKTWSQAQTLALQLTSLTFEQINVFKPQLPHV